jgi:hypothetical protein
MHCHERIVDIVTIRQPDLQQCVAAPPISVHRRAAAATRPPFASDWHPAAPEVRAPDAGVVTISLIDSIIPISHRDSNP